MRRHFVLTPLPRRHSDGAVFHGQADTFVGSTRVREAALDYCSRCGAPLRDCVGHHVGNVGGVSVEGRPLVASVPGAVEKWNL